LAASTPRPRPRQNAYWKGNDQRRSAPAGLPPAVTAYPEEISRRLWQDRFPPLPLPLTS
jgi:hypothetical protein